MTYRIALAAGVFVLASVAVALVQPGFIGYDYALYLKPAALALLRGGSPYGAGFFGPAWALIFLAPLVALPDAWAIGILTGANAALMLAVARRLGAGWLALLLIVASPPFVMSLITGNLDGLALLGVILPPPVGLFFLAVKPQLGLGLGLLWLVEAYRAGGVRQTAVTFGPVTLALAATLPIFGLWPLHAAQLGDSVHSANFWPWLMPAGLAALAHAIRTHKPDWALSCAPVLSPYASYAAWVAPLLGLARHTWELAAAVAGLWLAVAWTIAR